MPYNVNNPPDVIKKLPKGAQEIWIAAFNSALEQYKNEGKAHAVAWAATEKKYHKIGDNWVAKASEQISFSYPVKTNLLEFGENNITNEIKVIPAGVWNHPQYGKIMISENDIDAFIENFNKGLRNDLPITEGHEEGGESKPAVGWFKKLINKGRDGLWAVIEWTEKGRQLIQEKAYKYFSPEFYTNYEDPETRKKTKNVLVGGALVNRPYFKSLPAIVLSENLKINETMNIEEIIVKSIEDLTDEEKDFLKANQEALSEEDKTKFASILEEPKEEPKEEETKEEAKEEETKEEPKEEQVEGSEKNILISKEVLKVLEEKAELGVKASEELRKQKIESAVNSLTFSEHNSKGTFLPKSKDKVVSFLLSLPDEKVEVFKEIMSELPKAKIFGELGSDSGIPISASERLDGLVEDKRKENDKLSYREALDQVLSENPDITTE